MNRLLLNALLFLPDRSILAAPTPPYEDVAFRAQDGTQLHGWWVPARAAAPAGHVLLLHGNAGNVGDRAPHAELLRAAGFDVLLFDYRGYGRSRGNPTEPGTYRDARAARAALLERPGVDQERVLYLGESLGGAVALELALAHPPAGLVLQSTFTSIRDMARRHYPFIPPLVVPDAYPSLRRVAQLRAPLLVIHGDRDEIVPLMYAEALFEGAAEPKRMVVLDGVGHNDLITFAGAEWAEAIAAFALDSVPQRLPRSRSSLRPMR